MYVNYSTLEVATLDGTQIVPCWNPANTQMQRTTVTELQQYIGTLGLGDVSYSELSTLNGVSDGITPVDSSASTVTVNMTNANADLTYTSVGVGTTQNGITVTHVDPEDVSQTLAVTVVDTAITVSLATDENGDIISTAAEVKVAVNADEFASVLVVCEDEGDGSGVVEAKAVATLTGAVNATAGTIGSWRFKADGTLGYVKVSATTWKKFTLSSL